MPNLTGITLFRYSTTDYQLFPSSLKDVENFNHIFSSRLGYHYLKELSSTGDQSDFMDISKLEGLYMIEKVVKGTYNN